MFWGWHSWSTLNGKGLTLHHHWYSTKKTVEAFICLICCFRCPRQLMVGVKNRYFFTWVNSTWPSQSPVFNVDLLFFLRWMLILEKSCYSCWSLHCQAAELWARVKQKSKNMSSGMAMSEPRLNWWVAFVYNHLKRIEVGVGWIRKEEFMIWRDLEERKDTKFSGWDFTLFSSFDGRLLDYSWLHFSLKWQHFTIQIATRYNFIVSLLLVF